MVWSHISWYGNHATNSVYIINTPMYLGVYSEHNKKQCCYTTGSMGGLALRANSHLLWCSVWVGCDGEGGGTRVGYYCTSHSMVLASPVALRLLAGHCSYSGFMQECFVG